MNNGSFDLNNVVIEGHHVRLEPYEDALREPVRRALDCDPAGWELFAISGQGAHFDGWWDMLNAQMAQGDWIAYAIRRRATDAIVGTTSFLNVERTRQCVEIGATFLHPGVRARCATACCSR
jgi:RimJ/RimL family protein N-acetyltransferase